MTRIFSNQPIAITFVVLFAVFGLLIINPRGGSATSLIEDSECSAITDTENRSKCGAKLFHRCGV